MYFLFITFYFKFLIAFTLSSNVGCVENKFLKLPNVQKYEIAQKTENGFIATVEMEDGYEFMINAVIISQVFPSTVMQLIEKQKM